MIGENAAAVGIVTVVGLICRAVHEVHEGIPAAGVVELERKYDLGIGGHRSGAGVILECVGVGLTCSRAAGVEQLNAVCRSPVEHSLVGVDCGLPAFLVCVAPADEIVVLSVIDIRGGAVEQGTCCELQCAGLDGERCALGHAAGICRIPLGGEHSRGLVAEVGNELDHFLYGSTWCGEVVVGHEGLAHQRHAAVAVEHAHVAVCNERLALGLHHFFLGV